MHRWFQPVLKSTLFEACCATVSLARHYRCVENTVLLSWMPDYGVNIKSNPLRLLLIFQHCVQICIKLLYIPQCSECFLSWQSVGSYKKASLLVMRWGYRQTWRGTELLHMLAVIAVSSHSHVGSQHLKFDTALSMCSCDSSSQMVSRATFYSSVVLGFDWVYGTFQHCAPYYIVQQLQIWRVWATYSSE